MQLVLYSFCFACLALSTVTKAYPLADYPRADLYLAHRAWLTVVFSLLHSSALATVIYFPTLQD